MQEAIAEAEQSGNIYFSSRFNATGHVMWIDLLKEAAREYDEHWLAFQLDEKQMMTDFEGARTLRGGYRVKYVPQSAAEIMAEGQFNRFYILGLCRHARKEGIISLVVYRAKPVANPRSESERLIGTSLSVDDIESQLKVTANSFKSNLVKPNSGLSVKLPS